MILSINTIAYSNVLAEEPVRITGQKKYFDDSGLVHIAGIIQNTGKMPVGPVDISISLTDKEGNLLPSYQTTALYRTVMPGYTIPFDIPISDRSVGDRVSSYTLSIKWNFVEAKHENIEFSGINAYKVTHLDPRTVGYMGSHREHILSNDEPHAHTEVSGYISNTGNLITRSAKVAVIWYDDEGKFKGVDWQYVSKKLGPGEKAKFVFMTHPEGMGFYSIVADSNMYVAMLKVNGENIIPIYEAPRPNMNFVTSQPIDISNLLIVDENNKPISEIKVGQMVLIQSVINSNIDTKQKFTSIFHVKDSDGATVMLFWMSSQIPARESLDVAISWIPEMKGSYTLQIFLWESLKNPVPVGDFSESTITVST